MAEKKEKQKKLSEVEQLQNDLLKKQEDIDSYIDQLKRLQAEFENYMKRSQKEKEDYSKYASHKVLLSLLNLQDDFDRAFELLQEETENKSLVLGFDMIHKQIKKILSEEGVALIESLDQKADPFKHEILGRVESEKEEDIIVEELQKGYTLHDRVLRASKVRVSKGGKQ